jgi:nuclear pore complex protein Nup205
MAINPDFQKQTIFLSQHLDVSERYVASLLLAIHRQMPSLSLDAAASLEACVVKFHQRRRDLADCLQMIFEGAKTAQIDSIGGREGADVYRNLDDWVRREMVSVQEGGTDVSMASRIFRQIEMLGNEIQKAMVALQNAKSNTTGPDAGACFFTYVHTNF